MTEWRPARSLSRLTPAILLAAVAGGACRSQSAADGVVAFSAPLIAGTASWLRRPSGTNVKPSGRVDQAVAYDPDQRVFVFFGGFAYGSLVDLADTWQWDPATARWTQRMTAAQPSPRRGSFLFYDRTRHAVMLFGGYTSGVTSTFFTDMWQLDPVSGNWTDVTPVGAHPRFDCAYQCSGSYDKNTDRALFIDGEGFWIWNGSTWEEAPATSAPPIASPALAYDVKRSKAILSVARTSDLPLETWQWAPGSWAPASTTGELGARIHQAVVFDASRGNVVLFGGSKLDPTRTFWDPQADTWEWDGVSWSESETAIHPPAIQNPELGYDELRGKVVLFDTSPATFGDVWEYQVSALPNGSSCSAEFPDRCGTSRCVDDVCCDSECGGSNTSDCQACSVAAGGSADGICTPVVAAHLCRPAAGPCDRAETCDGSSNACPGDDLAPAGQICHASPNVCGDNIVCSGLDRACSGAATSSACAPVPTGATVQVDLLGGLGVTGGIALQFSDVQVAGAAAFIETGTGAAPPGSFRLSPGGPHWSVGTSATAANGVQFCVHYDQSALLPSELAFPEQQLRLLHDDGLGFVNVTTFLDTQADVICGSAPQLATVDTSVVCPTAPPSPRDRCDAVPVGTNVRVDLLGGVGGVGGMTLEFAQVVEAGSIAVIQSGAGPPAPGSFAITGFGTPTPSHSWQFASTVGFTGPVQICVQYNPSDPVADEARLMLVHDDGTGFVNITTAIDVNANVICGMANDLGSAGGGGEPAASFSAFLSNPVAIDGVLTPSEWGDAAIQSFSVCGGANPGRLYVKNDATDLYVAVVVDNATWIQPPGTTGVDGPGVLFFDRDIDGILQPGDNVWNVGMGDNFIPDTQVPGSHGFGLRDTANGGTNDFVAAVTHTSPVPGTRGTYTIEYRGSLDSADNAHDFSLFAGATIGFYFALVTSDCESSLVWPNAATERPATIVVAGAPIGWPCTADAECTSAQCVDGVCCATACGGNDPHDCQACAVAAGASKDGVCSILPAARVCRAPAGTCDVAEVCDGTQTACPADQFAPASQECRASAGVCDAAEFCSGGSAACPADLPAVAGKPCRLATRDCDLTEVCDGNSFSCPLDRFAPLGQFCRAKAGECDVADSCDGVSAACPDEHQPAGTACTSDSNVCTVDQCDGNSADCQHPAGNVNTECRAKANGCDVAEVCTGLPVCPADAGLPAETCAPVEDTDPVTGFLGWTDDTDVGNNPVGSVGLIFSGAGDDGTATVTESPDGEAPPAGFKTVGTGTTRYWDIQTQDTTFGSLIVCVRYSTAWLGPGDNEMMLQLWHLHAGIWKDVTLPGYPDPNTKLLCGEVTELSTFAVLLPLDTNAPSFVDVPGTIVAYATSTSGAKVTYTAPTATDAADGPCAVTCTPASGTKFAPGKTTVTCTASDSAGNSASASFTVWVQYQAPADGSFFLQPINPDGSSVFKRGSTIPVKFKLQGASAAIANLAAHLTVAKVSNGVSGTYVEAVSTAACDGGDSFRYDAAAKQYIFNLSTKAMTVGTWSLRADLGDRVDHAVNVSLR